ncbi:MAG: hypothetical protein JW863_22005 [Chitinispirillaceae bacterium]|nr:hypothetical protein [Chitinispirillaceae bacterium]
MKKLIWPAGVAVWMLFNGCGVVPIEYDNTMLDGPVLFDTSLTDPTFRLSTHPELDTFDRDRPVIISAHGYTASTFEWMEFREFAREDGRAYTSLVLLGGHGTTIEDFDGSTWEDWQAPIMEEYDTLVKLGFTRISMAGSSTGASLVLELISRRAFDDRPVLPREFFLIDPIVVPSDKLLHLVSVAGPVLGNSPRDIDNDLKKRHWYTNRPASTLAELNELIELLRGRLEKGFSLPEDSRLKCYKVKVDDSADPVTALLIYKGLTTAGGAKIDVEMIDSEYHVFTQLATRTDATEHDYILQRRAFTEMIDRVTGH